MNRVLLISDRLYLMILILGITMGIETILQAKRIIIAAFTEGKERKGKERILLKVIERGISSSHSATFLYNHGNKLFVLERTSTLRLTRYQASWLLEAQGLKGELQIKYNLSTKKKGVKWLSQKIGKLILRLLQEFMRTIDYQSQLHRLILWDSKFDSIQRVSQYQCINQNVFNRITGWSADVDLINWQYRNFTKQKAIKQAENNNIFTTSRR